MTEPELEFESPEPISRPYTPASQSEQPGPPSPLENVSENTSPIYSRTPSPSPHAHSDSDIDSDDLPEAGSNHMSVLDNIRTAQEFIQQISQATLANCKLDETTLDRLRNPEKYVFEDINEPHIQLSLDLYMACSNASQATYNAVRDAVMAAFPETNVLSYHLVTKLAAELTGVCAVRDDMCVKSCVAFTGPFSELDKCPTCHEPRFNAEGKPWKQACTIPLGPQLQCLRMSTEGAQAMRYRDQKTTEIINELNQNTGNPDALIYDDFFSGSDYLDLAEDLGLTEHDTTVILSVDGAQIYQNKKSDTWIAIWVVYDYNPKTRYKKKRCLPAAIIPGPEKPKNLGSMLFRSLQHVSALQRENNYAGLRVWDAIKRAVITSRILVVLGTADALGLVELDGRVGHHGALGCCLGCKMKGRTKGSGHYCAAHLRPSNLKPRDPNHPDFDFRNIAIATKRESVIEYKLKIGAISAAGDVNAYKRIRKQTGISKPSILSGLYQRYTLPMPLCTTLDVMHTFFLNIGDLILPLFRGTIRCDPPDKIESWDWAVLTGDTWTQHGKLVAEATKYFPSSFHRPPRNPAEKINSGFKATEWYLYLFGLGPAFFRPLLPAQYWRNFCKLVFGVRTIIQRSITGKQLREAHTLLCEFVEEFELLYYQRRRERLHFCRPALHTLLHCAPETMRIGPLGYDSQYTLEGVIGILVSAIGLPSAIFENLVQVAIRQAQISALKTMCPALDKDSKTHLPRYSFDLGHGYVLLQPRTRFNVVLEGAELEAVSAVTTQPKLRKWGRLCLPNGQIARSVFAEDRRTAENKRNSRNIKVNLSFQQDYQYLQQELQFKASNVYEYGEVQFYFTVNIDGIQQSYAVVLQYSPPILELLDKSYNTLWACSYSGRESLKLVPVDQLVSVVSMQPMPKKEGDPDNLFFVVEKSGLDDMGLDGHDDPLV